MTTAIIGVGNLGGTVARHLVNGGEAVVLAAKDESRAQVLADDLGSHAGAASVADAIDAADTVVLAVIHLPDHDTLMLIDIVNPGWVPIYQSNLSEDIPGYLEAPANALAYSWKHFIGGHNGRLGTRDDITLHQQYMTDLVESSRKAIDSLDPTPFYQQYPDNPWAAVKGILDETARRTAEPVTEKYTGVLAAADVFTEDVAFQVMQSVRLDLGYGSWVHP